MGWLGFLSAEKSDGDTGKVSDVKVNIKTEDGKVKDVLVSKSRDNPHKDHTHYYEKSSGWWGTNTKGKG